MRFALLGDHADGLEMARALTATGRHALGCYSGSARGLEQLLGWGLSPTPVSDIEEILADPAIEAVIVASPLAHRPAQLRRAVQSERAVLCVHPAGDGPDIAYEVSMMQADTRCLLLPIMTEGLHPALDRIAEPMNDPQF